MRKIKDCILVKIPLTQGGVSTAPKAPRGEKMTVAERRLWKIIQDGEREHRVGKTIEAASIDEALKIYERRKSLKGY